MLLTAQRLAIATGLVSRRRLRRLRPALARPGEEPLAWDHRLEIGAEPQDFELLGSPFRAQLSPPAVVALHKPLGTVTSRRPDGGHMPVFELLRGQRLPGGLEAVGRLDQDTRGLLLFTGDGTLLHRLTHPRWGIPRTYLIAAERPLPERLRQSLLAGTLELRDGHRPTPGSLDDVVEGSLEHTLLAPAESHSSYRMTLSSGRYHEVKRIFAACQAPVARLFRVTYGPLDLCSEDLTALRAPETVQRLDAEQVEALYAAVSLAQPEPALEILSLD